MTDNQLRAWNHVQVFASDINEAMIPSYPAYPQPNSTASVESRARAYFAVNCSNCHRPGGTTPFNIDFRFNVTNAMMNVINVMPTSGTLGIANPYRIRPGDKASSVVLERMKRLDGTRMPPLGTSVVDQQAVDLIGAWIDSLPP